MSERKKDSTVVYLKPFLAAIILAALCALFIISDSNAAPCASPTPMPTRTATPKCTVTVVPTCTAINGPTLKPTSTPTRVVTLAPTASTTPIRTAIPSLTPTSTATSIFTALPVATSTNIASATPTATVTFTATNTNASTVPATAAPTIAMSATATATPTPLSTVPLVGPTVIPIEIVTPPSITPSATQTATSCSTLDNKPNQLALDGSLFSQFKIYSSAIALGRKIYGAHQYQRELIAAKNDYTVAWTTVWSLPVEIHTCAAAAASVCNLDANNSQRNTIARISSNLNSNALKLIQKLGRVNATQKGALKQRVATLKLEINKAYKTAKKNQAVIAAAVTNC